MSDRASPLSSDIKNLPPAYQAVATILFRYGAVTLIAGFLLWFLTIRIAADVRDISSDVKNVRVQLDAHVKDMTQFNETLHELIQVNRQICLSVSKTDQQRQECIK